MPLGRSKYCSECGSTLETHFVAGEERNHWFCRSCEREHHEHPLVVVTAFIAHGDSLLWVRRAIEPRRGSWAIPGGYLEQGETLQEGAARELREEAGVIVAPDDLQLYMMGTLTFINQIYVGFRASVDSIDCNPGPESLECAFFTRDECPWNEVAYPEVNESIEQAYADLQENRYRQWHVEMTADSYNRVAINPGPLGS